MIFYFSAATSLETDASALSDQNFSTEQTSQTFLNGN